MLIYRRKSIQMDFLKNIAQQSLFKKKITQTS